MDSVEEFNEGIQYISDSGAKYRHVHVELKCLMGDEEYQRTYDKYAANSLKVSKYLKDAKGQVKALVRKAKDDERSDALGKAKRSIMIKISVFQERLEEEVIKVETVQGGKASCERYERFLDEYYNLLGQARIAYGDAFNADALCKPALESIFVKIRDQILHCKSEISRLQDEEENDRDQKLVSEKYGGP